METTGPYPITLVTAYFRINKREENSPRSYEEWMMNFLPYVHWPLAIFCDEQSLDGIKRLRGNRPAVYFVTRPEEFHSYKYQDIIQAQCLNDAEVSMIWHEKHNFLRRALLENPFDSEMFFWCDIGCFRFSRDLPFWSVRRMQFRLFEDVEWPNLRVCRALPQDKVVLARQSYLGSPSILAQFFGGAMEPTRRWCGAYYQRLEERAEKGAFTCSEEWVMQSLYRRRPELVHVLSSDTGPWPRLVGLFIRLLRGKHVSNFKWYFLSGRRFPWKYLYRRIFSGAGR